MNNTDTTDKFIKNKFSPDPPKLIALDDLQAQVIRILKADFESFTSSIKPGETFAIASIKDKNREIPDVFEGSGGYLTLYVKLLCLFDKFAELGYKSGIKTAREVISLFSSPEFSEETLLKRAEISLEKLRRLLVFQEKMVAKESEINISFYFGGPGIYLNGCILSLLKKDTKTFKSYFEKLLAYKKIILKNREEYFEEVLYGISGYIYSLLTLQTHLEKINAEPEISTRLKDDIIELVELVINRGIENYGPEIDLNNLPADFRLVYRVYEHEYFGAAHGLFGILNILLRAYQLNTDAFIREKPALNEKLLVTAKASLGYLLSFQQSNGSFPSSEKSKGKNALVQFCHGAPGAISCLLIASQVFKGEEIAEKCKKAAVLAGEGVWEYGILKKGYGLCHGITGNGYSFITLYRYTNDMKWLYRALCFISTKEDKYYTDEIAEFDIDDRFAVGKTDYPYSLMLGLAGDICMEVDAMLPETARFPGYEV